MSTDRVTLPKQLALLPDAQGMTLQQRFQEFTDRAVDALTTANRHGEPCFEAGKAKSTITVKVAVVRIADDSFTFSFEPVVSEKHPQVPGVATSAPYIKGKGVVQQVTHDQAPLFAPDDQPAQPMSIADYQQQQEGPSDP